MFVYLSVTLFAIYFFIRFSSIIPNYVKLSKRARLMLRSTEFAASVSTRNIVETRASERSPTVDEDLSSHGKLNDTSVRGVSPPPSVLH